MGLDGSLLQRLTQPAATAGRVVARAADQAQQGQAQPGGPGGGSGSGGAGGGGGGHGVLATIGAGMHWMTSVEKALTAPLGAIPFPGISALRVGDNGFGPPHAHNHPPNLIPPAPPVPLPSIDTILQIPILSGASSTKIDGSAAARCGDMGLGVWCGGFFPLCEVYLGSATVWVEDARAARMAVDITKHCVFSSPKPSDPPMGPMIGMTITAGSTTKIGGVPLPSFTAMAIAAAFKAVFKVLGKIGRAIGGRLRARALDALLTSRATQFIEREILGPGSNFALHGDEAFANAVRRDMIELAKTRAGRELLDDLRRLGKPIDIHSPSHLPAGETSFGGPYAMAHDMDASRLRVVPDPNGPFTNVQFTQDANGNWSRAYSDVPGNRVAVRDVGPGSGSSVVYDPAATTPNHFANPESPSDAILGHELNHARNNALGQRANELGMTDPNWNSSWQDLEEHNTVGWENRYRQEQGLPNRPDYTVLPGYP